jgi:energy-coupling factor transporter ATP-binding protein EcfA2
MKSTLPWPWTDEEKAAPWIEKRSGLQLADTQRAAIRLALMAKALVITGGPGVGKTTIVNSILKILAPSIAIDALASDTSCEIGSPTKKSPARVGARPRGNRRAWTLGARIKRAQQFKHDQRYVSPSNGKGGQSARPGPARQKRSGRRIARRARLRARKCRAATRRRAAL